VADRVPQDVLDHVGVVVVADDAARREAVAEEVALPVVLTVELLRVHAVDAVQAAGERRLRCLDDEVVVVPEQRQRMDGPAVRVDGVVQEPEERETIADVAEDRAAVDAFDRDVEDAVWEPASEWSGHPRPR
jgi:hypothetical protein